MIEQVKRNIYSDWVDKENDKRQELYRIDVIESQKKYTEEYCEMMNINPVYPQHPFMLEKTFIGYFEYFKTNPLDANK
jgi:hypothetical protein